MNNSELQGGGLWNLILSFWPLKEQRDLEKQNQLELNIPADYIDILSQIKIKKTSLHILDEFSDIINV